MTLPIANGLAGSAGHALPEDAVCDWKVATKATFAIGKDSRPTGYYGRRSAILCRRRYLLPSTGLRDTNESIAAKSWQPRLWTAIRRLRHRVLLAGSAESPSRY